MNVIVDSNEYILFFDKKKLLLDKVFMSERITIHINEIIAKEVLRNIEDSHKKEFYQLLLNDNVMVDTDTMSLSLFQKYEKRGLKKGDIAIAAFCEKIGADYLITENRHFLKSRKRDAFRIIDLKKFVSKLL